MTKYRVELLDTETDEVVEYAVIEATDDAEARVVAEEEAAYQGYFAGTVTKI
jgi:hypothetical protein